MAVKPDDVLRWARQSGLVDFRDEPSAPHVAEILSLLTEFAALVEAAARADEREQCAMVCDDLHHTWRWDDEPDSASGPRDCAAAIRARGSQ